jgi:DivIVA domain-containing protein
LALDRQTIEKKDFPIGRRGYEPEAVDAHLNAIAAEVDTLERSARRRSGESLAATASAQVQAIVEAAESSAAEIEREARDDADRIREDATSDAQRTRQEAVQRSADHVGKVGESTALMLQRVDAMESELSALVESLRTGANRLNADLSLLEGNMGELYAAAGQPEPAAPAPAAFDDGGPGASATPIGAAATSPPAIDDAAGPAAAAAAAPTAPQAAETAYDDDVEDVFGDDQPTAAPPASAAGDEDVEGARLIALNMALNGQPREETERYLAENFDLADRGGLLDEVYASVG